MSKADEIMIKVCGKKCNSNLDLIHIRKIIDILAGYYKDNETDISLMEIIAGLTFAITGNFESVLDDESTIEEDKNKTKQNINKLYDYLYGGY